MSHTHNAGLALAVFAALGLGASLPAAAQTVVVTGASLTNPGTNLTAVGTTDWAKWGYGTNITTFVTKSGSAVFTSARVGDISNVTGVSGIVPGGPSSPRTQLDYGNATTSPTLTWTDGSTGQNSYNLMNASDNSRQQNANYSNASSAGIGMGWTFSVTIPALSQGTFYLYEGGYNSEDTLSVTSSDGTLPSSYTFDNVNGGADANGSFTAAINNVLPTADTLNFTFYENKGLGLYDNPKLQAAALSLTPIVPAPEPSSLLSLSLAVLGLGGMMLKARRRAVASQC